MLDMFWVAVFTATLFVPIFCLLSARWFLFKRPRTAAGTRIIGFFHPVSVFCCCCLRVGRWQSYINIESNNQPSSNLTSFFLLVSVSFSSFSSFSPLHLLHPLHASPTPSYEQFANSGGGGERVLWCAIKALEEMHLDPSSSHSFHVIVYTGDNDATPAAILKRCKDRFGVEFEGTKMTVEFQYLQKRAWVRAEGYSRFTLLGQSFGSMVLGWEALRLAVPDVFIDSTGYAFTMPLARLLGGCTVIAYTHYPTISTDMLNMVFSRRPSYNNASAVSNSRVASGFKYIYYWMYALLYRIAGQFAHLVMVNSTWTYGHIAGLWGQTSTHIVYPPCDVERMAGFPLDDQGRNERKLFLSIGQFRPEKDHALQLRAVRALVDQYESLSERNRDVLSQVRLYLIGSCRDDGDRERVQVLEALSKELKVEKYVQFQLNAPFPDLCRWLGEATAGLHTMWNEHFGIGVVEMQTAGCIPIAHNSAGPRKDIVIHHQGVATGLLAETPEEYAEAMAYVLNLDVGNGNSRVSQGWSKWGDEEQWTTQEMRTAGRASSRRFSETCFKETVKVHLKSFV